MSSALEVNHLVKNFNGNLALNDVSLKVEAGSILGLVGQNGAGKSTLINIVSGVYVSDSGTIEIDGGAVSITSPSDAFAQGIRVVQQELVSAPNLSVAQTLALGHEKHFGHVSGKTLYRAVDDAVHEKLGIEIDSTRLMRDLQPAEIKLVQIARAIVFGEAKVLILDEPTAPLSEQEAAVVFRAIRQLRDNGTAIIYVSHYLGEVLALADAITVFRNGRNVASIDDPAKATTNQLVELMVGRPVDELYPTIKPLDASAPVKLQVDHLSGPSFDDCSFTVRAGEIVGIGGITGSGSDELVDAVFGEIRPTNGTVRVLGRSVRVGSVHRSVRHGIVRVPRDRRTRGFVLNLPVRDNLTLPRIGQLSSYGVVSFSTITTIAKQVIERLGIRPPDPSFPTRQLSGGNQQKVAIGSWIGSGATILLLEDPTVGIDIGARADIYRTLQELAETGVGILIVSNDFNELAGLCHRVFILNRGSITREFTGAESTEKVLLGAATEAPANETQGDAASTGGNNDER